MATAKRSYIFKTIIVGDGAVGKTSLVMMFTEQKFQNQYIMTIGSNFALKLIPAEILSTGKKEYPDVRLQLWDLAGQPHFRAVRHPFYKGSSGIIYVYDVTRPETLEHLNGWREEILKQVPPTTPAILLANKVDLKNERKVTDKEGKEFMGKLGARDYFETSAKDGVNVNAGFQVLARMIVDALPAEE